MTHARPPRARHEPSLTPAQGDERRAAAHPADPPALRIALFAIAGLAVAIPTYVVTHPPRIPREAARPAALARLHPRVLAPTELPPVEPVNFVDLSPDDARAYNATVPFSTEPNPAARPFRFAGDPDQRARAVDCLAAAVLYEAGDDATGEKAVAQVVLNRLHHPAFPKTVCGVVFEGSERATGCQFTFTCDGALTRWTPSEAGWRRARAVAALALSGSVFRPIGYATHYHTDWVVPYWQSSLDKIAAVGSHLFFRWSGWWGTPPAFNRQVQPDEPVVAKLAALSDAHRTGAALAEGVDALTAAAAVAPMAPGAAIQFAGDPDTFVSALDPHGPAEGYRALAIKACGERAHCKFLGWTRFAPAMLTQPLAPDQLGTLSFSYLRDRDGGYEKALWNCAEFKRPDRSQCMKTQVTTTAAAVPAPATVPSPAVRVPDDLTGVRRRTGPAAAPTPTGTPAAAASAPVRPAAPAGPPARTAAAPPAAPRP